MRLLPLCLLVSALSFAQNFQDVSAAGCPISLTVERDLGGHVLVMAHNSDSKGVLAIVTFVRSTDNRGQVPGISQMDYIFKFTPIHSGEDRGVFTLDAVGESIVVRAEGSVLFAQFEDGSTWGNPRAAKGMIAERPAKFAYLAGLIDTFIRDGNSAFQSALDSPKPGSAEYKVAACLKSDAQYQHIATIDLARKRLADAQSWHHYGIF
jgi:hypothetical protein